MPTKKAEGTGRNWKQLQYLPVLIHLSQEQKQIEVRNKVVFEGLKCEKLGRYFWYLR